ncbi:hypothetical protein [Eubacterium ventriosum]|uniref:hypothetical protein n=1 Tax=Eubacterium ventriosum TaxID=39496 RepID=UPI00265EAABC|nr:hypothetical protein [Eubacterium ventriosum]
MEDYGIVNNAILEQAGYFEKHIDKNVVVDTDAHFIIDAITRKIKNTGDKKELVQGDHNSERFTFECPRYIEGHDMTLVNKIIVNYMNVSTSGAYEVDDLTSDDEKITFSWLISKNATENVGKLVFAISFKCVQEDEKITYEWHTTINDDIRIIDGLNNETSIVEDNVDILEQWKRELFGASDGEISKIQEASNQAQTEIENMTTASKNDIETLATNSKTEINSLTETKKTELNKINDDITQNAGELKEAIVNAADAKKGEINQKGLEVLQSLPEDMGKIQDTTLIKSTESGTEINLTDSSDMNIQELHFFGKSEQKTTKGIQLLDLLNSQGGTGDGVTYTPNGDGSFRKTGTATGKIGNIWLKGGYYSDWENKTPIITLEVGKSYYIKDCAIFQGQTNIASGSRYTIINVTGEKYPEGIKITGIRNIGFTLNKTYNEVIYPIIAESSTAVDWEEYTGGQPSPSPDYPQDIESVENPIVSVAGKNLFEPSTINYSYNNLRITANVDNSQKNSIKIKINTINATEGDLYALAYVDINKFVKKIKSNTTYTIVLKNPQNIGAVFVGTIIGTNRITNTVDVKSNVIKLQTIDDISNKSTFPLVFYFAGTVKENVTIGFDDIAIYEGDYPNAEIEEFKEIQTTQQTCKLNGIDDVRDELIVRGDGTGQIVQKIYYAKKIKPIDGKFSKDESRTNTDLVYFNINTPLAKATTFAKVKGYSNIFSLEKRNIWVTDTCGIDFHTNIDINKVRVLIRIEKNDDINTILEKGVDIEYELKNPIVTELSSEEVQKILALHTNKPNTTIWNDQNADMQITYIADTKSYIDNKFKELSDAIVASASEAE